MIVQEKKCLFLCAILMTFNFKALSSLAVNMGLSNNHAIGLNLYQFGLKNNLIRYKNINKFEHDYMMIY